MIPARLGCHGTPQFGPNLAIRSTGDRLNGTPSLAKELAKTTELMLLCLTLV